MKVRLVDVDFKIPNLALMKISAYHKAKGDSVKFFQPEDLYRVETLRGLGVDPFVMPYDKTNPYQKRFARWVNHKAIFKTVKWEDYIAK